MGEQKHTPGPWRMIPDLAALRYPKNMIVATLDCMGEHKHIICTGVTTADGKLIEKAPDLLAENDKFKASTDYVKEINKELLAACKYALERYEISDTEWARAVCAKCRAAIAKAEEN